MLDDECTDVIHWLCLLALLQFLLIFFALAKNYGLLLAFESGKFIPALAWSRECSERLLVAARGSVSYASPATHSAYTTRPCVIVRTLVNSHGGNARTPLPTENPRYMPSSTVYNDWTFSANDICSDITYGLCMLIIKISRYSTVSALEIQISCILVYYIFNYYFTLTLTFLKNQKLKKNLVHATSVRCETRLVIILQVIIVTKKPTKFVEKAIEIMAFKHIKIWGGSHWVMITTILSICVCSLIADRVELVHIHSFHT